MTEDLDNKAADIQEALFDLLVVRSAKYLIIQYDVHDLEVPTIYAKGLQEATYDEMKSKLCEAKHGVGLVWVQVEHIARLFVIKYVQPDVDDEFKSAYPDEEIDENDIGFVSADTCDDLALEKVLQSNRGKYKLFEDEKFEQWDWAPIGQCQYESHEFAFPDDTYYGNQILLGSNEGFDPRLVSAFNDLRTQGSYKYVMGAQPTEEALIKLNGTFDFCSIYPNLLENLGGEFTVVVYDFRFEGKSSPFALIWKYGQASTWAKETTKYFIEAMKSVAVPTIAASDYSELDIDKLIEITVLPNPEDRFHITEDTFDKLDKYVS
jgi:hypothetical protein